MDHTICGHDVRLSNRLFVDTHHIVFQADFQLVTLRDFSRTRAPMPPLTRISSPTWYFRMLAKFLGISQESAPFSWWQGSEGFICGSEDCVDSFPVEGLRQSCRLDGSYQHAKAIVSFRTSMTVPIGGVSTRSIVNRVPYLPLLSWAAMQLFSMHRLLR